MGIKLYSQKAIESDILTSLPSPLPLNSPTRRHVESSHHQPRIRSRNHNPPEQSYNNTVLVQNQKQAHGEEEEVFCSSSSWSASLRKRRSKISLAYGTFCTAGLFSSVFSHSPSSHTQSIRHRRRVPHLPRDKTKQKKVSIYVERYKTFASSLLHASFKWWTHTESQTPSHYYGKAFKGNFKYI